jgi:hypothetical protein
MKRVAILLAVFTVLACFDLQSVFAHREITNQSGKPVRVMDLNDAQGKPFARLFMTGEKMSIDHYQYPESGAGYYEALEGETYLIPFTTGGLGGLHVDRIEWDDTGKTVAVKGLRPYFDGAQKIDIVSDTEKPRIENGVLYLRLKQKETKEYRFTILYGMGVSIEPSLYE